MKHYVHYLNYKRKTNHCGIWYNRDLEGTFLVWYNHDLEGSF